MNDPQTVSARSVRVADPDMTTDPVADAYRRWGYLQANVDPLQRLAPFEHPDVADARTRGGAEENARWRSIYCGSVGFEFMHMMERERVEWMREAIEAGPPAVDSRWVLSRLMETELFERFLHLKYVGTKRFSIEGIAGLIPLLDSMLDASGALGADFLYLGMSHRGRLNVMKSIVNLPIEDIFAGIEDVDARSQLGSGDVKYHIGATGRYTTHSGHDVEVHLASNPSHLEAVDSVVMGRARARQERWGEEGVRHILPITLHGDAAFAGQGITSETLNLADLDHYRVGGTIHVIVNNFIGFTAEPAVLQSSRYASDAARRVSMPIIHVNAEDPEAVWWAGNLAAAYRYRFGGDVVVDLIGFRRYGHSEIEDPTVTQPLLYAKIAQHPLAWEIHAQRLGLDAATIDDMKKAASAGLSESHEKGRAYATRPVFWKLPKFWGRYQGGDYDPAYEVPTAVDMEKLRAIAARITHAPDDFSVHPKIAKLLKQRAEMVSGKRRVDWGMAEALAFGSLLTEGVGVRLTGQDSRRGTFNHRHAALIDTRTGADYVPLEHISEDQARFVAVDSPLTEAAALGFEYGYSREFPDALVLWEAQFGDFANGAQVIIDQFVSAGEDKWNLLSGLVMLLPHGSEGQGPEHSSARPERYLQLAAQDNIQVAQPSTAGNYFHLLRRQILRTWRKPLVVMMPKSTLRAEPACSPVEELATGAFRPVIGDDEARNVRGVILCTGKIAHELRAERVARGAMDRAIVTIEQLYPFPADALKEALSGYPHDAKIIWVQEEPANMGALAFIRHRIKETLGRHVTSVKRYESASPATGSAKAHALEQKALLKLAFA
ncbi:MAG TPA: 2-oxoglutarate dehydrogenase E1 component [Candidatus Krumholzibacteria bacterium]|nr:2-oxoglutarate dehydrogenase E1 component [Candidatus Krumholzibacteria bacterium]